MDHMCLHPTTTCKIHKVHITQGYNLVIEGPIENLAYKV